jgi:hypothetical protein
MVPEIPPNLEARLTRARIMLQDGRRDEGVEEIRRAVYDATSLPPREGRTRVEEILRFAKDNDAFEEVEDFLESESLIQRFFASE